MYFRCFVYKGNHHNGKFTYDIAQSGDATCNGLLSTAEGSKTLKLTTGMLRYMCLLLKLNTF